MNDGDVIVFPTDTVYGMGVKIYDELGLKRIYEIKKRDFEKKIPILLPDLVSVNQFATYNNRDYKIMRHFWPGTLTIVLNANETYFKRTGYKTVALRIPNYESTLDILKEFGPLWVTSVNVSGEQPLNDVVEIKRQFSHNVTRIYEEYDTPKTFHSSTVIDLTDPDKIKILRQGLLTLKEIEKVLK